jgi:hypothetical protein
MWIVVEQVRTGPPATFGPFKTQDEAKEWLNTTKM